MTDLAAAIASHNAQTAAWVAEDPQNRYGGELVSDLSHWESYGIFTAADLERYLLICIYNDAYLSVHGVKPLDCYTNELTNEELISFTDTLFALAHESAKCEAEMDAYFQQLKEEESRVAGLYNSEPLPYEEYCF